MKGLSHPPPPSSIPFDNVNPTYFSAAHVYHSCMVGVNDRDMALEKEKEKEKKKKGITVVHGIPYDDYTK